MHESVDSSWRSSASRQPETWTLREVFDLLHKRQRLLIKTLVVAAIFVVPGVFLIPASYTAKSVILPPQQSSSGTAAILGQFSSLSNLGGLSFKQPGDLYIGLLNTDTIADTLIERFHLKNVYRVSQLIKARKALARHTQITLNKYSLIDIEVEDRDPTRAAELANGYVEALLHENESLAISEAGQRRLFFDQQVASEKNALAYAEMQLKQTQEETGVTVPGAQESVSIQALAALRAQLSSKQTQLSVLLLEAGDQNPDVLDLRATIANLRAQINKFEQGTSQVGDVGLPSSKGPMINLLYVRMLREEQYHEMLYELLAKQDAVARLDESKAGQLIQVASRATIPDQRSWPPRALYIGAALALAGFGACSWILFSAAWQESPQSQRINPESLSA